MKTSPQSTGEIVVREVKTQKERRLFVSFPNELYRTSPYYVPPMYADELADMDPRKNPASSYAEASKGFISPSSPCRTQTTIFISFNRSFNLLYLSAKEKYSLYVKLFVKEQKVRILSNLY